MQFQVLGPLRVIAGPATEGEPCAAMPRLPRKKMALLALLLVRANQVVSLEQLTAELWNDHPPRRATAALHVYVSQLRRSLEELGGDKDRIVTCSPGYSLRLETGELDLHGFRNLVFLGRGHLRNGRHAEASAVLWEAIGLWHGTPLPEVADGSVVGGFVRWIEELRLEALEMAIDADLALGRERELVSLLYQLVGDHPLHEMYHRQLMMALARGDRRAEALEVYRRARATLTREVGLEPSRPLQEMHCAILATDTRLEGVVAV